MGEITLRECQKRVDAWIRTIGVRYYSELTNTAVLMEEVGEVARLMSRMYGDQSFKKSDESVNLPDEMADVLFVLICLANQTGVDLTAAFHANMDKKTGRDKDRHANNPKLRAAQTRSETLMTLDLEKFAAPICGKKFSYAEKDVSLYALSIGAATDPTDPLDLPLVYELHNRGFQVFPTFAVTFPFVVFWQILEVPGLNFNPMMLLHGEQFLEVKKPLASQPARSAIMLRSLIFTIRDPARWWF
jgi:NTP pyrophosphatase (non-canonical NTP hydrolase)